MGASEIEVIALCTVAVRMALVNTRTAKVAVNPATVSKAFKARMSLLLRGTLYGQKRSLQFAVPAAPHLYCGKPEWCLNLGLSVGVDADHPRAKARRA